MKFSNHLCRWCMLLLRWFRGFLDEGWANWRLGVEEMFLVGETHLYTFYTSYHHVGNLTRQRDATKVVGEGSLLCEKGRHVGMMWLLRGEAGAEIPSGGLFTDRRWTASRCKRRQHRGIFKELIVLVCSHVYFIWLLTHFFLCSVVHMYVG